ncbi:MAG: sulfite exporter TauE/SafE family protein [Rubrivivax sp.]|nr:MAG: sulfite exporter TauE/SafE family protein [Rubrivivax sp.]
MEFLTLMLIGSVSGLIAGLVGLAGGIVVVPALTWLYGPAVLHDAIVVSWFAVLFNSIGAVIKQLKMRDAQERLQLLAGAKFFLAGAVVVTPLVALVASEAKRLVTPHLVALLQMCLAAVMLWPVREENATKTPQRGVVDASFGGLIGGVSTLIGVGGGTYTIAYFVYGAGSKFRDAIATANLTGLTIGALSVAGYLVSLLAFKESAAGSGPLTAMGMALLIVSGMATAPLGVRLSRILPTKTLRQILIFALIVSSLKLMLT